MKNILIVMIGGGIGSVVRYVFSNFMLAKFGPSFPLGTLGVNLIGCFIIGLFFAFTTQKLIVTEQIRLFIMVGFLGGLTTFSSFSNETLQLLLDGRSFAALLNVAVNVLLGLTFTYLGIKAII